ncbi:hypothetical protein JVU11DRAFT_9287 [Chiua virens]|nr:hypothetical protein JVU11DRAFT_9287 [Chiua virens]
MPLQSLPDCFDLATHQELDRAVNEDISDVFTVIEHLSPSDYIILLVAIVRHSRGDLDSKYLAFSDAKKLMTTYGELRSMLASARELKSYREIRNLAILRTSKPPQPALTAGDDLPEDLHGTLSGSFAAKYCGAAVDGFYEYLTQNEKLFKETEDPKYYAKFCSIVQSSGTGKSRMLTELGKKDVIVLYMNLRDKDEKSGFPARDSIPSAILTEFPSTEKAYRTICYAFFIALFDLVEESLSVYNTGIIQEAVMEWVHKMCDMSHPPRTTTRSDFFRKLSAKYEKTHADLVRVQAEQRQETASGSAMPGVSEATETTVDQTADRFGNLTLSDLDTQHHDPQDFVTHLLFAYNKLVSTLDRVFPDRGSNQPKLVIAIDEAHPLTPPRYTRGRRPADILCRIVNQYSHVENGRPLWVVFASTTSKVADFSPPNKKYNSDRVANHGEKLFPPYTQLGWDQSASALGRVGNENVSQLLHIAGYGRPLWLSLKTALTFPERMLKVASSKLCGGNDVFDATKTSHVLAILGQRFGLKVALGHPDSVEHLENGVASHLRICLSTTLDRTWRWTDYPSEPLLSCVAAKLLHVHPDKLDTALTTLMQRVNSGMIDMGQRGELASRLLWLLAKDLFVRTRANSEVRETPSTWDEHLVDCQMIPVVDWLEFVFGPRIWDDQTAKKAPGLARKAFENVYLNFSHWVCMEASIAGSKAGDELRLDLWTQRHWQRTSAVQCCHQQRLIDKVIPIYFKAGTETKFQISQIFISDKAKESTASKDGLRAITRTDKGISRSDSPKDSSLPPYIAILADLGQPPAFSVTFPEREIDDRCLRIYVAGVDETTYPFLAQYPTVMKVLENLVRRERIPETETPYTKYLDAQVKFGSTATAQHMKWEHGSSVPVIEVRPTVGGRGA